MSHSQLQALSLAWSILRWSLRFFVLYYPVVGALCVIAAVGRTIQVARRDALPKLGYGMLELVVEGARVLALFAIVYFSPLNGTLLDRFVSNVSTSVVALVYATIMMLIVAGLTNLGIAHLSKRTHVLNVVRRAGTAAADEQSLQLAASLFLKNVTVIPFTLVWLIGVVTVIGREVS
jgi:hypothetical protein